MKIHAIYVLTKISDGKQISCFELEMRIEDAVRGLNYPDQAIGMLKAGEDYHFVQVTAGVRIAGRLISSKAKNRLGVERAKEFA